MSLYVSWVEREGMGKNAAVSTRDFTNSKNARKNPARRQTVLRQAISLLRFE